MAGSLCSILSPNHATSYFEQDSFLISSQKYGSISARKTLFRYNKSFFSEAKKSVFGKIWIWVPGTRFYHLANLPSSYCIVSHFVQFIPLLASFASYFHAEHLNFPWWLIFDANLLTLHSSMPLVSYFWADHWTLHPAIRLAIYFQAIHLTLHPSISLASYFRGDHLNLHLSIHLASYFRAHHLTLQRPIHLFGELFSSWPFNSASSHQFGELFSSPSFNSLGELFSCRPFHSPSFGEGFFVPTM